MLQSEFVKFLMSVLKWEFNSSPNFALLFSPIKQLLCTSLAQTLYTLVEKKPLKWTFLRLECSGQNLSNSSCQFWNDKSIPYQIFHHSSVLSKLTPLYLFSSNNIYFDQKDPIKVKTLETFECSGQNLSNASCQFWNDKLIPLQNFHHSSLP